MLRKKTLLITAIMLCSLFVALYTTSKAILLRGFAHIEEQDTQQNVRRVLEAYNAAAPPRSAPDYGTADPE